MDESTAMAEAKGNLLPNPSHNPCGYLLDTDRYEADPNAVGNPNS